MRFINYTIPRLCSTFAIFAPASQASARPHVFSRKGLDRAVLVEAHGSTEQCESEGCLWSFRFLSFRRPTHPGAPIRIFWGVSGRRIGVAMPAVSNSLILGGWVTKVLKNGDKKLGGGGGGGEEGLVTTIF